MRRAICASQISDCVKTDSRFPGAYVITTRAGCGRPFADPAFSEVKLAISAIYSCGAVSADFFSRCRPNFSMRYTSVLRVMFRNAAARV